MRGYPYESVAYDTLTILVLTVGYVSGASIDGIGHDSSPKSNGNFSLSDQSSSQWAGDCTIIDGFVCGHNLERYCEEETGNCWECKTHKYCRSKYYDEIKCKLECIEWWKVHHSATTLPPKPPNTTSGSHLLTLEDTLNYTSLYNGTRDKLFADESNQLYLAAILTLSIVALMLIIGVGIGIKIYRGRKNLKRNKGHPDDPIVRQAEPDEEGMPLTEFAIPDTLPEVQSKGDRLPEEKESLQPVAAQPCQPIAAQPCAASSGDDLLTIATARSNGKEPFSVPVGYAGFP